MLNELILLIFSQSTSHKPFYGLKIIDLSINSPDGQKSARLSAGRGLSAREPMATESGCGDAQECNYCSEMVCEMLSLNRGSRC